MHITFRSLLKLIVFKSPAIIEDVARVLRLRGDCVAPHLQAIKELASDETLPIRDIESLLDEDTVVDVMDAVALMESSTLDLSCRNSLCWYAARSILTRFAYDPRYLDRGMPDDAEVTRRLQEFAEREIFLRELPRRFSFSPTSQHMSKEWNHTYMLLLRFERPKTFLPIVEFIKNIDLKTNLLHNEVLIPGQRLYGPESYAGSSSGRRGMCTYAGSTSGGVGGEGKVYLYGGQVNDQGEELQFISNKAIFKPPEAVHGGIVICFPQFCSHGNLEQNGFARNQVWSIDTNPPPFPTNSTCKAFVDLILKPSEEEASYEFRLRITLGPGGDLMLTSRIRNTSAEGKPLSFTFAFHTPDISGVHVEGLETLDYLHNLKAKERFTEQGDAITFESEVDKVYLSTPSKIAVIDLENKRTFVLRKEGLPDAVVWNPWDKKAKAMADFGDDEYKHMLCVDAAVVEKPITLKPGEEWEGRQEISGVPSSYCSSHLGPQKVLHG